MTSSKRRSLSLLPFKLVEEILYRLPIESLVRFKSTCKQWSALLDDNRFIYKKLDLSKERFIRVDHKTIQIFNPEVKALLCLPTPDEFHNYTLIKTIQCDGLLLCIDRSCFGDRKLAVWNPILSRVKWIEPSNSLLHPLRRIPDYTSDFYGFGYDNVSRDNYKILRMNRVIKGKFSEVEIYEFNSKLWRSVDATLECDALWQSVSMNGNMYWIVQKKRVNSEVEIFIQSFDFSTETFKPICCFPIPKGTDCFLGNSDHTVLLSGFRGDRLSLLHQHKHVKIEVWVTSKVTHAIVSWSKYFDVIPDSPILHFKSTRIFPKYFSLIENNKIMFLCDIINVKRSCINTSVYEMGEDEIKKQYI